MALYLGSDKVTQIIKEASSGTVITTTNKTSYAITSGEKVWINGSDLVDFYKQGYSYNFDIIGNPTFNNQTGVASNFTSGNYLKMLSYPTNITSMEYLFKIRTPSTIDSFHCILGQSNVNRHTPQLGIKPDGKLEFSLSEDGSAWAQVVSSDSVTTNTWYGLKCIWNGTTAEFFYSTNGTVWNSCGSVSCNNILWDEVAEIGADSGGAPFTGSIDLKESYIKINGVDWWFPLSFGNKKELNPYLKTTGDYVSITSNFVASGFQNTSCIYTQGSKLPIKVGDTLFLKFTTANVVSSFQQRIVTRPSFLTFEVNNGYLKTWNWSTSSNESVGSVSDNTTYWVKIEFLSASRKFYISTDGINWSTYTVNDSRNPSSNDVYFGRSDTQDYNFGGSIDFKGVYVKNSNGDTTWSGVTNIISNNINESTLTGIALENIAANSSGSVLTTLSQS